MITNTLCFLLSHHHDPRPSFRKHQSTGLRGVALASDYNYDHYDAIDSSTGNVNYFKAEAEDYHDNKADEKKPLLLPDEEIEDEVGLALDEVSSIVIANIMCQIWATFLVLC